MRNLADWCEYHRHNEPVSDVRDPESRVCGECGHYFVDAEELVSAHNARQQMIHHVYVARHVLFCPLCTHDW